MSTPLRVVAFVVGPGRRVRAGVGRGPARRPARHRARRARGRARHGDDGDDAEAGSHDDHSSAVAEATGLTARADGFTLALADRTPAAGRTRLDFQVLTSSGRPLLDYTREHEKDLHLIVVRRDLTGFQHVHPRLDRGDRHLVGGRAAHARHVARRRRLRARGLGGHHAGRRRRRSPATSRPRALPADDRTPTVETDAGTYTVTLAGDTAPGAATVLTTRIELDGEPVTDLEPYLGAYGHLVAMRAGDLGYLHVHPEEGRPGPGIDFATAFPDAGDVPAVPGLPAPRRQVRTAAFTVESGGAPGRRRLRAREGGDHDH